MAKGLYYYIKQQWKSPDVKTLRERMVEWRKSNSVVKVEKPLRLDRARALGYKAKKGFIVARVRLKRGGHKRPRPKKGRKVGNLSVRKNLSLSYQAIAEQRAAKKFKNLEVLNSYWVGKDGTHYFYEVILADPDMPEIKSDRTINWISNRKNRNRVFRGLTSSGKKARSL
ncbi:MAG: 50S ribosomal protein L15e [Candidatus Pacearchaeota archaeon]